MTLVVLALSASPASAVVGGSDAGPAEFPSVVQIEYQPGFGCTGTLISPDTVLTAGHCSSVSGAAVASPIPTNPALITVWIGSNKSHQGERIPISSVVVSPNYAVGSNNDVSVLKLSRNSTKRPTPVAGAADRPVWTAGTLATISGWGTTAENGSAPTTLQKARVPITTDAYCAGAYSNFDAQTMVCAGYPQGGTDSCQGDSGGPLFASGLVVGATSFGDGCARPGKPGVYARVADDPIRSFIRGQDRDGVRADNATSSPGPSTGAGGSNPSTTTVFKLLGLRVTRTRFTAARGTTLRMRVSKAARVRLRLRRVSGRRLRQVGAVDRKATTALLTVSIRRTFAGKRLRTGSYRLQASARDPQTGRLVAREVAFRVVR